MTRDEQFVQVTEHLRGRIAEGKVQASVTLERWAKGERKPNSWFYRLSYVGCATEHYGQGCHIYRTACEAVETPLPLDCKDEAIALAVEVLNRLGFLLRYGGFDTDSLYCRAENRGLATETKIFADMAKADLGAALALLENFGGLPRPTPAEQRHNERVMRQWQEDRVS